MAKKCEVKKAVKVSGAKAKKLAGKILNMTDVELSQWVAGGTFGSLAADFRTLAGSVVAQSEKKE